MGSSPSKRVRNANQDVTVVNDVSPRSDPEGLVSSITQAQQSAGSVDLVRHTIAADVQHDEAEFLELRAKVASSDAMMKQMMQQMKLLTEKMSNYQDKGDQSDTALNMSTEQLQEKTPDVVQSIPRVSTPQNTNEMHAAASVPDSPKLSLNSFSPKDGDSTDGEGISEPPSGLVSTNTSFGGPGGPSLQVPPFDLNASLSQSRSKFDLLHLTTDSSASSLIPLSLRPKSARQQGRPQAGRNVDLSGFEKFAREVFNFGDSNQDGMLSLQELRLALSSTMLLANLNYDDAVPMFFGNHPEGTRGLLTIDDFFGPFGQLLQREYSSSAVDDDEWVHVGVSNDGKPVYFNHISGEMVEMARVEAEEDHTDKLQFVLMVDEADNAVHTTYIDEDGQRYFADGDRWTAVPASMNLVPVVDCDTGYHNSPLHRTQSPAVEEEYEYFTITDPQSGQHHQAVIGNEMIAAKKFLNGHTGKWQNLPSTWEATEPDVVKMLREIDDALPDWGSVSEQVLALRMCNYVVQDAIAWKYMDVQCNGGNWNTPSVKEIMRIAILEAELTKKDELFHEINQNALASALSVEELRKQVRDGQTTIDDQKSLIDRQARRISRLEEELQQQFEDSQRATARQRARITGLEAELDLAVKQSSAATSRQSQQISMMEEKIALVTKSRDEMEQRTLQQREELQVELFAARKDAIESQQLRNKVSSLEKQLDETRMDAIAAASEAGSAQKLSQELAIANARLQEAEQYNKQALTARQEVEQKNIVIAQLQDKMQSEQSKLETQLQEKTAELDQLHAAIEGSAQDSTADLNKLEQALVEEKERRMKAADDLTRLKHSTTKMMEKLQFTLSNIRASNNALKRDTSEIIGRAFRIYQELHPGVNNLIKIVLNFEADKKAILDKYRQEVIARKVLYNQIQELKGNIRVFCRVRKDDCEVALNCISETEVLVPIGDKGRTKCYEFDRVYDPSATQAKVYEDAASIIQSVIDGYNVCYLAYGQTGSGKTFTMMGPPDDPDLAGVNRRAIYDLFKLCREREDVEYELKINMVEIYNDNIYDLLAGHHSESLRLKQQPDGTTEVEGLIVRQVSSPDDVTAVLAEADENRSVAATAMNMHSSRSHLILQITVSGVNKISEVHTVGKLSLVDLAGSERVNKSEAKGARLVEAVSINKSLTSLGMVFNALGQKQKHIPYRNCKLTHLLQDSLGGDAKACMFLNLSPAETNLNETRSTLNFGQGIGKIELGPIKKNVH